MLFFLKKKCLNFFCPKEVRPQGVQNGSKRNKKLVKKGSKRVQRVQHGFEMGPKLVNIFKLDSIFIFDYLVTILLLFWGRVEVRLDEKGPWGPICGDGWGVPEAIVSPFNYYFQWKLHLIWSFISYNVGFSRSKDWFFLNNKSKWQNVLVTHNFFSRFW